MIFNRVVVLSYSVFLFCVIKNLTPNTIDKRFTLIKLKDYRQSAVNIERKKTTTKPHYISLAEQYPLSFLVCLSIEVIDILFYKLNKISTSKTG